MWSHVQHHENGWTFPHRQNQETVSPLLSATPPSDPVPEPIAVSAAMQPATANKTSLKQCLEKLNLSVNLMYKTNEIANNCIHEDYQVCDHIHIQSYIVYKIYIILYISKYDVWTNYCVIRSTI